MPRTPAVKIKIAKTAGKRGPRDIVSRYSSRRLGKPSIAKLLSSPPDDITIVVNTSRNADGEDLCPLDEPENASGGTTRNQQPKRRGHDYGDITVRGSASAHIGDKISIVQHQTYFYVAGPVQANLMTPFTNKARFSGTGPVSAFEARRSFCPWSYTQQTSLPELYTYFAEQVVDGPIWRIDQYSMLYFPNANRRIRLSITLLTPSNCDLWHLAKLERQVKAKATSLPLLLTARLRDFLHCEGDIFDDSHLRILAGEIDDSCHAKQRLAEAQSAADKLYLRLRELSVQMPPQSCPWYYESELDHRLLTEAERSDHFLVRLNSRWVLETRFSIDEQIFESNLYTMRVLQRLDGSPGIPRFRGVLRDDRGTITAFLNDLPSRGRLAKVMIEGQKAGKPVPRERLQKWCKQIVAAMAAFHDNSLVLGVLGAQMDPPIVLDENDNATLYTAFQTQLLYRDGFLGALPPECRPYIKDMPATPETDLYNLGLVLWRLAGYRRGGVRAEFCKAAGCTSSLESVCLEPHTDPISLPMPSQDYPDYLRQIINACRAETPQDRIPASKLLAMFPDAIPVLEGGPCQPDKALLDPDVSHYRSRYEYNVCCDGCGQHCSQHYFHCNICNTANFDLCPRCFFERRLHCHNDQHYMREFNSDSFRDSCYSAVQADGQRKELILDQISLRKV